MNLSTNFQCTLTNVNYLSPFYHTPVIFTATSALNISRQKNCPDNVGAARQQSKKASSPVFAHTSRTANEKGKQGMGTGYNIRLYVLVWFSLFYFEDDIYMPDYALRSSKHHRPTTLHLEKIYLISQRKSVSSHRLSPTSVSIYLSGRSVLLLLGV